MAWEDLCLRHGGSEAPVQPAEGSGMPAFPAVAWSARWLPLLGGAGGDHTCVDLRMGHLHRYGQILWFLHDRPERPVIARDIGRMFLRVADGVETGAWRLDAGFDGLSD